MRKEFSTPEQSNQELLEYNELCKKLRDPSVLLTHKEISFIFNNEYKWKDLESFCFDKENPTFEFLNEDFLNAFCNYLSQQIENLETTKDKPITILEVGAGNGRLTHFLQQKLEQEMSKKVKIIATDSGEWKLKVFFPTEQLTNKMAIEKYRPEIIISSWMPHHQDFTKDFRLAPSVKEYILIGEANGGCCGDEEKTWGLERFLFLAK